MFQGFVELEDEFVSCVLVQNPSASNVEPDAAPTFRVYKPGQDTPVLTGVCEAQDTGDITAASNAEPIVVTSASHGLGNGVRVSITGVLGNTAANATWTIESVTDNTFTLHGSAGDGAYTSGGEWT